MWWIGGEVNMRGDIDAFSWDMWKEWLEWQVPLIRASDPDAVIAISFGSWTDYHELYKMPPNAIHEVAGAEELIDEGIDYDVIAIEYHYGSLNEGGIAELKNALRQLGRVGKDIFIWEAFYPGGTDPEYQSCWGWDCGSHLQRRTNIRAADLFQL
jgi:arabinogalactan endo-1,4-beta-galactosidase